MTKLTVAQDKASAKAKRGPSMGQLLVQPTARAAREAAQAGIEMPEAPEQEAVAFVKKRTAPAFGPATMIKIKVWDRVNRTERTFEVAGGDYAFASEKQAKFMLSIALNKQLPPGATLEALLIRLQQGFARHAASQFISTYKDLPDREVPVKVTAAMAEAIAPGAATEELETPKAPTEDGIYVDRETGRIFKLQFNKATGDGTSLYAKQLTVSFDRNGEYEEHSTGLLMLNLEGVPAKANGKPELRNSWEYVRGLIREIKPEWRLSADQAVAWGVLYGSCVRCHRDLTKESSIRQMMGDKCAAKQGF